MSTSNRFRVFVGAGVVSLIGLCGVLVSGRSPVGIEQMTSERWREDLGYLAEALPAKHGNAFNQVSKTDFDAACLAMAPKA